jgi:beta-glucanase (GH16 family)
VNSIRILCALTTLPLLASAADWKLVWSDEFDKPGLPDPVKWGYETGFIRNNEAQFYTASRKENARVENGLLIIEARKEHFPNPDFKPDSERKGRAAAEYTSASLTTDGKASWTGGRFEVKAKVPGGRGTWPAIWMLGNNRRDVGWPTCGEIDIMEFVGYDPGLIHANVHTAKFNHMKHTGRGDKIQIPDAASAFHIYALEWFPDRMDFFLDGKKYFTCKNDNGGDDSWPFDKPQYLILNLAIGGAWGGQKGIDDGIFPARFEIDYVRVYAPQGKVP